MLISGALFLLRIKNPYYKAFVSLYSFNNSLPMMSLLNVFSASSLNSLPKDFTISGLFLRNSIASANS